jgi:hypothetical protein
VCSGIPCRVSYHLVTVTPKGYTVDLHDRYMIVLRFDVLHFFFIATH